MSGAQRIVLIVEDDQDIALLFETALRMRNFAVQLAAHGAEALERLRAGLRPDVIIADLHMPVMDGWDLLRALHADAVLSSIPIIVLTAGDDPQRQAPRPATILQKPVTTDALVDAIGRVLPAPA